jgi:hypothetical protein
MAKTFGVALMLAVALVSQGCATGAPTGVDVNYTLDGVAYRTFSAPMEQMQRVTLNTLKRMDLALKSDELKEDGCRELVAAAGDRTIYVELEKLTARTTRMRIIAKHGWVLRDRATAGDFIVQTERSLTDTPAVSQRAK